MMKLFDSFFFDRAALRKPLFSGRKAVIVLVSLIGISGIALGQDYSNYQDYSDYSNDYSNDDYSNYSNDYGDPDSSYSSEGDDYSSGYSNDYSSSAYGSYGSGSDKVEIPRKKVVVKPYERFVPPYDSTRELVMYQAVIEVLDPEGYEVEIDTINYRAHQWLEAELGKNLKKFVVSDDMNTNASETEYKIRIKGTFPCIIEPNEFTQVQNGEVEYVMEIRVRDGRYRYVVKNLVHVADPRPGEREGERTYFEFLMKTEDNVRSGDQVLIAADKKITAMMLALQKACQTAPIEEEDEW